MNANIISSCTKPVIILSDPSKNNVSKDLRLSLADTTYHIQIFFS